MEMTTMQERLNNFEMAQETICFAQAIYTGLIYQEKRKPAPDEAKIALWDKKYNDADDELRGLRLDDDAGIQAVTEKYTVIIRENKDGIQ